MLFASLSFAGALAHLILMPYFAHPEVVSDAAQGVPGELGVVLAACVFWVTTVAALLRHRVPEALTALAAAGYL